MAGHHGPINMRLSFPHRLLVYSGYVESAMRPDSHTQLPNNRLRPFSFLFLLFFCFFEDVAFFRVFLYHFHFLFAWRLRRAFFSSGWCFSTLWPRTGSLISDYLCENSINQFKISRVRLPTLLVISRTGKMVISLSAFAPENLVSRDGFGSPVPRQPAHLHAQAESGAYLQDSSRVPRRRPSIYAKPPYAVGSVPSLSCHAIAYRWRSLPRVRRHRAGKPQGSSERVPLWQITMGQLICASLPHTDYWYIVGMLKVPCASTAIRSNLKLSASFFVFVSTFFLFLWRGRLFRIYLYY